MTNQTIQAAIQEFFQTKSIKKQMDVLKALQKHKEALQGLSGLGEADIVQIVVGRAILGDPDLTGFINHMINHFFKKGQGGITAFNDSVKPAGGILSRVISGRTSLPPLEEALIENMERTVQGQINDESLYSTDGDRKLNRQKTYTEEMFVSGIKIDDVEYVPGDNIVYGRYGVVIDPITGGDPGELVALTDANGHMLPGFSKDKIAQHNAKVDREAEIKDQEAELTQSKIKLEAIKQTLETKYGKDCFAYIDDLASSATDPSSVASFKENIEKIRDLQGKFRESLKDQMNEMTLVLEKAARTHHKGKFTREELQDAVSSEYSLPIKDDIMQRFLLKKLEAVETPATITDALRGINSELADDIISEKNKGTTERRYFSGIPEMSREIVQTKEISTGAEVDNLLLTYLGTNPSEKLDKFAKSMRNYMELYPAGERNTKVSLIVEMSKDQLEELNKMTDLGEIHAFSTEYDVAFNFAQLPTDVQKAVKAALNTRSNYFRLPLTFFDARMNELKGKLESTALKENFKDIYECSPVDFIERIKEQIDLADEGAYDFYIEVTQDMQKSLDGLKQIHKKVVENKPLTPNERKIYEGFEEDAAAKYFEYYTSSDSHKQQDQMTTYIEAQDRDLTELNSSLENGKRIYSSQSKVKQASAEVAKARSQHVKAPDHISYYPETVRKFTGQTPLIDDSLDSIKQSLIDEKKRLKAIAQQNSNAPKNFSAVSKKGEFKKQMNSISRSIHTWPIPTNYDAVITDLDNLISKVSAATSPLGRIDLLAPAHDTTHMNQTDIGRIGAQAKNLKSHLQCLRSIKNIDDAINEIDQTKKSLQTDTSVSESVSELRDAILSTGNKYADLKDVFSTLRTLEEISAYDIHLDTDSGMDFIEPSMPNAKSATDTAIKNIENILPIVKSSEVKHSMQIQLNKLKKTKEAIEAFNNSKQTYIATAGEASTLFKTLFDKSILPLSRGDETRGKEKAQQKFLFLCAKYLSGMEDGASYKTVENDLEFAYEQVQNLLSVSDQTDGFKRRTAETSNISSSAKNDIQEFKKLSTLVKHVVAQRKATLDLYDEASIQGNASEGGMTTYQDNQLMSELRSVTDIVIRNKGTEDYAQFCSTEAKDKSVTFSTGLDSKTADTMAKSMRKMQANFAKNRKQSKKSFDAINKLVSGTAYDIRQKSLADVDGKSNGSIDFLKESLNKFAAAALSDKNTSDKLEAFVGNLKADKKYQDLKPSTSFPEYKKSIADCGDDTAKEKYQECGYSSERVIASLFSRKNLQTAESYGLDLKAIKQLDTKWISTLRDNFLKKIEKSYAFPLKREDIVSKEGVAKKTYIEKLSEYEEKIKDYNEAIKTREDAVKSLSKGRPVKPGSPYNSAAQEHACLAWDAYKTLKDDEEMTLDQLQAHIASTPGMVQLKEVLGIPTIVNGTMTTYPDYIKNLYDDLIAAEKVLTYCRGKVNEAQGRDQLDTPSTVPEPKDLLQSAFPRKKDSVLSHLSGYKSLKKQKSEIQTAWNFDVLKSKIGEFLAGMKFSPKDTTEKDLKAIEQILEGIKGKITTMKDVYPKSD